MPNRANPAGPLALNSSPNPVPTTPIKPPSSECSSRGAFPAGAFEVPVRTRAFCVLFTRSRERRALVFLPLCVLRVPASVPSVLNLFLRSFNSLTPPLFYSYTFRVFKPRTIDSEPALYDAAVKILMRRAHSVSEMKKALIRRTADEGLIQKVIARLKQNGLIDDARYAKQFARQRTEIRHQGKFRVARELRARGLSDEHIESAVAESSANSDEAAMVRQRIDRKLRLLRGTQSNNPIDEKKIASLYRTLLRAGFSSETIRRELHRLSASDLSDSDAPSDV